MPLVGIHKNTFLISSCTCFNWLYSPSVSLSSPFSVSPLLPMLIFVLNLISTPIVLYIVVLEMVSHKNC